MVQGFYRFPCFTAAEGMRNHPSEQPDATDISFFTMLFGLQIGSIAVRRRLFISSLLALDFLPPVKMTATPHQIRMIVNRARQAWLEGNGNAFAELFLPSGEFIVPGHCYRGQDQILEAFQAFTLTTVVQTITIHNLVAQENQAVVEWHWQEENRSTGERSQADDAIAIDVQGERIQRWREYIDAQSSEAI